MPSKKANQPADSDSSKLKVEIMQGADERRTTAKKLLQPEVRAALLIQKFEDYLDVNALAAELKSQTDSMVAGDMSRAEEMLGAQAHTLDALFCTMARRAHSNMVEGYTDAAERYLKLGLKAQVQCIRTIEAMSELKNPKQIAYVGQANFAGGHQQVNNSSSQAGENKIEQTKLSGMEKHELSKNCKTQGVTCSVNSQMEAMGTLHRAKNPRG